MKCPKCQHQNREGAKFCLKCGEKLELKCPQCARSLPAEAIFCDECGYSLSKPMEVPPIDYSQPKSYTPKFLAEKILTTRSSIEGERKLVTVLFADVANYTSMSERLDPEEVHQIMDGCFNILMDEIHRYEGTINQFTGDGVMALFGAPVAHEDHAQRACYAALSIRKAIADYEEKIQRESGVDFKLRMGLNSGPVIVGSIGDDLRMDYTAVGDTTNLASRMESMARPGTVLVTGYTHKLAKDFFQFSPLGKVEVKGKEKAVEGYELLEASGIETRIDAAVARGLTKFVGRRREVEALREAYDKARSGAGQVVGIVGEAGVGKSRIALELRSLLTRGEYTYLEGQCLHYGGTMAYLPILDILRSYFDIEEGDREFIIKKKMGEKILQLDEKLKNALAPLQEILSLKVEDQAYLKIEHGQKKERIFEAIRDLLVRASQEKPLVLIVEDLHWIDKTSEEFLGYLIGWLANTRILLILLYRPEYTHQWGSRSYYNKIGVDQLSSKTSAELVQTILEGGEVVPELRDLILNKAGGNPLFVEELTHSLVENGSIQRKDNQYILTRKVSEIEVPDTIQGIIAARIDRMEENLKRIMQVASVIGRDFAFRILQTITGMREELKSHLINLQGLEFIYEKSLFPELEYIFKHAITQEVAYNSLLLKRRKDIHEKIGRAIEGIYPDRLEEFYEVLAYHYGRSANMAKAVEYLDLANQKAARVSAMEEAKAYFDEAMRILGMLPETEENQERRISLLVNQTEVFMLLYKYQEYYELLTRHEPMAIGLGNPGLLGALYSCLGHCQWGFGHFDQAIETESKALELVVAAGNAESAGFAYLNLQWSHLFRADYDRVIALKEDILRTMEEQFNLRMYVWALTGASWAYNVLGRFDEALEEGHEALKVAEEFSDNSMISFAAWTLSFVYTGKGDLARGLEYAELGVQKALTPADKVWAQGTLAWVKCRAGEPRRGVEMLAEIVPISRSGRFRPAEIGHMLYLGEAYWLAEEYDKANQTLKEVLKIAEQCGARFYTGCACLLLGMIALETKPPQAMVHLERSIIVLSEIKAEKELAMAYAGYGQLYKQQGNVAKAREYLAKSLEILEQLGALIEPDKIREALAELPER